MRGIMTLLMVLSLLFTPAIPAQSNMRFQKVHTEWRIVDDVQLQESSFLASHERLQWWCCVAVCSLCLSLLLKIRMEMLWKSFVQYKSLLFMQVNPIHICILIAVQSVH